MRRPLLALALALAAAGCGKSKQAEEAARLKAMCLGFPAAHATLNDIDQQYELLWFAGGCGNFTPAGVQGCPFDGATSFCRVLWGWTFTDGSLCSAFGCNAYCEAWTPSAGGLTGNEVVCATRFSQGQP